MNAKQEARRAAMTKTRNRRRVAIIGTLVIMVTFIGRDIVRDGAREKLTTLQNAQIAYLSGSYNSFVMIRVVDLTRDVVGFIHAYEAERENKHLPIFVDPLNPRPGLIEIEDSVLLADGLIIQNVESLLESLHRSMPAGSIPEEKEYADLKARLWKLKDREKNQMSAIISSQPTNATPEQITEVKSIDSDGDDLRTQALAMSQRVFSRTVDISSSLETSYERKNCIFYVFFVAGVLGNLWGTLAGLETEQDPS